MLTFPLVIILISFFSFMFCRSLFLLCAFSFDHCVVCSSSIYGFWLPLWFRQSLPDDFNRNRKELWWASRKIAWTSLQCLNNVKLRCMWVYEYIRDFLEEEYYLLDFTLKKNPGLIWLRFQIRFCYLISSFIHRSRLLAPRNPKQFKHHD